MQYFLCKVEETEAFPWDDIKEPYKVFFITNVHKVAHIEVNMSSIYVNFAGWCIDIQWQLQAHDDKRSSAGKLRNRQRYKNFCTAD